MFRNAFLAPAGHVANLAPGVTYKASDFPLTILVTIPDASWGGAQWKYDSSFQRRKTSVAPYYGWVTFERRETGPAQGIITMMAPYGRAPSLAVVVAGLRTRGRGATYGATSRVKLGGYSGVQFDGKIVGREHVFIPFSPKSTVAKWYPDNYGMGQGEVFRIIVLAVRGKTVVVYVENAELPARPVPGLPPPSRQALEDPQIPGLAADRGQVLSLEGAFRLSILDPSPPALNSLAALRRGGELVLVDHHDVSVERADRVTVQLRRSQAARRTVDPLLTMEVLYQLS